MIKKRMQTDGLVDVWRRDNTFEKGFTWFQGGSEKRVRLDDFLVSPNLSESIILTGLEPADNLSDHGSTCSDIGNRGKKQAREFWRFSNSLLNDSVFLNYT